MRRVRIVFIIIISIILFSHLVPVIADEGIPAAPFDDVPRSHWAFQPIHTLRSLKIIDGIDGNRFGLGITISRAEFVTLLVRLMQWELMTPGEGSYTDNRDTTRWCFPYIETALVHVNATVDMYVVRGSELVQCVYRFRCGCGKKHFAIMVSTPVLPHSGCSHLRCFRCTRTAHTGHSPD